MLTRAELPARLESALQVVYLIFNEGCSSSRGPEPTRDALCAEALRLDRLMVQLLDEPALGLLALMLLQQVRRSARIDELGEIILLENQDRTLWDHARIAEAQALIERARQAQ